MPDSNRDECRPSVISVRPFAMEPYPDRNIVYLLLIVKRSCQLTVFTSSVDQSKAENGVSRDEMSS